MKIAAPGKLVAAVCLLLFALYALYARVVQPPAVPSSSSILLYPPPGLPPGVSRNGLRTAPTAQFGPHGWFTNGFGLPTPLSLARHEGNWSLYSRAVSQITCADSIGPAGAEETWLGTRGGIKRLDARGHLLKWYTSAEGLPGSEVAALAVEPKEAWSVVVSDHAPFIYSLCRLDRAAGRWETLRQVPIPSVPCTDQTGADSFIAAGAPHSICFVLGNVARSESSLAAFVLDRVTHRWQEVSWDNSQRTGGSCFPYTEPTWACAASTQSGDCLYIGTPQGLGRYRIADGRWDWFLTDQSILGGADADGGALWLASLTKDDIRLMPPTANLHLLRFDEDKESVTADYEQAGIQPDPRGHSVPTFPGTASGVVAAPDGSVWLVSHRVAGFFHSQDAQATTLTRLDLKARLWQPADTSVPAQANRLPLSVLRAALLAGYALPTTVLQQRLPGWSSPDAELPVDAAIVSGAEPPPQIPDRDGAVWSVTDKNILTRRAVGAAAVQRFPPPVRTMLLTPQTWLTATAGDTLYALTKVSLWSKRLPDGPWVSHPLPSGVTRAYNGSLVSLSGQLWFLYGGLMYRWNPVSAQWNKLPDPVQEEFLGVDNTGFWFQQARGAVLSHVTPSGIRSEAARINVFEQDHNSWGFFRFAGGIAWLMVQEGVVQNGDTLLYGYDVQTHTWSARVRLVGHVDKLSLQSAEDGVYATVVQRLDGSGEGPVGDTYRFDLKTRQWATLSPTVPALPGTPRYAMSPDHVQFVSADAQNLWLLDTNTLAVWRWDRALQNWVNFPAAPPGGSRIAPNDDAGAVTRWKNALYAATQAGVWRFELNTSRWTSLPMPLSAADTLTLRPCSVDAQAVWALAYSPSRQAFAARFDKIKHTWKLWDGASGFPETGEPTDIAGDGVSALTTTYRFGAYHLNPKTDCWEDVSPALAHAMTNGQSGMKLFARTLASDPPDIWLHTLGYWTSQHQPPTNSPPPIPPLIRWDGAHARFEAVLPPSGVVGGINSARWSDRLLIDHEAVWLFGQGVFGG